MKWLLLTTFGFIMITELSKSHGLLSTLLRTKSVLKNVGFIFKNHTCKV